MLKFYKCIIKIFNILVVIFPLLLALSLGVIYLIGGWGLISEKHNLKYYFLEKINISVPFILLLLLWLACLFGFTYICFYLCKRTKTERGKRLLSCILVFLLSFGIRVLLLAIYREFLTPFSDLSSSWERAKGNFFEGGDLPYYSLFPAYLNFSVYENYVIKVLGESFINVLYCNAVFCGITAIFLYLISKEIINKDYICLFVCILYTLYPSNIFYTASGTPEFITICFNTIGVYFLIRCIKSEDFLYQVIWALSGGFSLGVGGSFKTYSIVMIIAFAMVLIIILLTKCKDQSNRKKISFVLLVVLVLLGYKYATTCIINISSEYFGIVLSQKKAIPHFLLIGLNTEAEGQIHIGSLSRAYYEYYLSNEMNYEAAKNYAYSLLLNDFINNKANIVPNLLKKMIWAWQDDYIPIRYFLTDVGITNPDTQLENTVFRLVGRYGAGMSQVAYLIVILLAFLGSLSRVEKKDTQVIYEFLALIIFGYFCMILLAEAQSRYKCLVVPYIMVFSGIGAEEIINRIGLRKLG